MSTDKYFARVGVADLYSTKLEVCDERQERTPAQAVSCELLHEVLAFRVRRCILPDSPPLCQYCVSMPFP